MIYGSQYFRPPFPYKEYWEKDLDNIVSLNFNTVKLWAVWNWIEREPGVFTFDDLDELIALCGKKGLQVVLNIIPEGAPYWTADGELGSFYEKSTGEILRYSGPANIPSAGWPGLCPDSPRFAEIIHRFITATTSHYAYNDTVVCFDVWNEPHLEPMYDYPDELLCYCVHTQEKFRTWLKARYGSLEKLNKTWFRQYTSWDQIEAPRRYGTAADMIDWRRFGMDNLTRILQERVEAARKGAPNKTMQTHVAYSGYMGQVNDGGLAKDLTDEFLLAREVDQFGLSAFPLWLMGTEHVAAHFMNVEVVAEASRGKPFYQVELQGGGGKTGLLGGVVPKKEDVRQWNWNIIAGGGKGVTYWQYRPEPAGLESPGFGQVNIDGSNTERSLEAGRCAKQFQNLDLYNRVLSKNAIFLSRNSDLLTNAVQEEKKYNNSFKGYHQAFSDSGIPCRFVHADYVDELYTEGVRTLYVPMSLAMSEQEKTGLLQYVKCGGTMILECGAGMYRENGELDPENSFLKELFGMVTCSYDQLLNCTITASKDGKPAFEGEYFRQYYNSVAEDCKLLAVFSDGTPAAISRSFGKGTVVWLGSFVGASYWNHRDQITRTFITSFADERGYDAIRYLNSNGMVVRLLDDGTNYALVCMNRTNGELPLCYDLGQGMKCVPVPALDGVIEFVKKLEG